MRQSKLIEVLRTLTPKQWSRFGDFLSSPFFNKNDDNVLFYNYLRKYAPAFEDESLSKETVLSRLKISKQTDEKALAQLMSRLLELLKTFLSVEQFLSDEFGQNLALMKAFHGMQATRRFGEAKKESEKILAALPERSAGFLLRQLELKNLEYSLADHHLPDFERPLQEASQALDAFFIAEKLRHACNAENLATAFNFSIEVNWVEQALDWSGGQAFRELTAIAVYRRLLLLLRNPEETAGFGEVRNLVAQHESQFEPKECKQLYTLLLNFCIRRINRFNDELFLREYLEINKLLLENGLIFENGHLQPWRYANLVNVGLKLGQAAWVWAFIHQFKNKLPGTAAENMFGFNLAQFQYHKGEHDKAQRALLQLDLAEDALLNVSARSLLLKIYYETDQSELLFAFLEATRLFVHRNPSLDAKLKRQLQKFIEFTAKLARLEPRERDKLGKLLEGLPPAAGIMHRDWVGAQIIRKMGDS